jgi:hypothetical protein
MASQEEFGGRSVLAYIPSNCSDIFANAWSAIARLARSGWSALTLIPHLGRKIAVHVAFADGLFPA